jgi:hypothetical protein
MHVKKAKAHFHIKEMLLSEIRAPQGNWWAFWLFLDHYFWSNKPGPHGLAIFGLFAFNYLFNQQPRH